MCPRHVGKELADLNAVRTRLERFNWALGFSARFGVKGIEVAHPATHVKIDHRFCRGVGARVEATDGCCLSHGSEKRHGSDPQQRLCCTRNKGSARKKVVLFFEFVHSLFRNGAMDFCCDVERRRLLHKNKLVGVGQSPNEVTDSFVATVFAEIAGPHRFFLTRRPCD